MIIVGMLFYMRVVVFYIYIRLLDRDDTMQENDEQVYYRFLKERNENDLRLLLERHRESLTLFLMGMVHNREEGSSINRRFTRWSAFSLKQGKGLLKKSDFGIMHLE